MTVAVPTSHRTAQGSPLKSARERMDIISAYRDVGTYRGAAAISGTTPKTVKRVIARHESGGVAPARARREHNYDAVGELVTERIAKSKGRITAKRLLPAARAAGYAGSPRNFRRLVADRKALWRNNDFPINAGAARLGPEVRTSRHRPSRSSVMTRRSAHRPRRRGPP